MKTIYIAEKPDIAASIAAYLWPDEYQRLKDKHCYSKGDNIVTWAYGHILMQAMPEAYDEGTGTSKSTQLSHANGSRNLLPHARNSLMPSRRC